MIKKSGLVIGPGSKPKTLAPVPFDEDMEMSLSRRVRI
jgi:hypothetical protein